jgi:glycosyltransferase involved in cell wall biosynthesis
MAKPIVTTNVAGCKSVVKNESNGFLCNLKDVDDLADKMERMYFLDEQERNKMGNRGRELIEQYFDENIVINKYKVLIANYQDKLSA